MLRQEIQYIRYDNVGSAACKPVVVSSAKKNALPGARKQKRKVISIDPVATVGILVALFMLVSMAVGVVEYVQVRKQAVQMEQYVEQLSVRNEELTEKFESGYDLEAIEKTALALGMVPMEQVQTVQIQVTIPQEEKTVTLWEQIGIFITGLFA